jgi:hypothetical protein
VDIEQILKNHTAWLRDEGGERADLSGANLSGADLSGADLRGADLRGADLRWADLSGADLRWADLSGADLRGADLRGADLSRADLSRADLEGIRMHNTAGDGKTLRTMQLRPYTVTVCDDWVQIGCEGHRWYEWRSFNDDIINDMDSNALEWWRRHKALVQAFVDADGCGEVGDV